MLYTCTGTLNDKSHVLNNIETDEDDFNCNYVTVISAPKGMEQLHGTIINSPGPNGELINSEYKHTQ